MPLIVLALRLSGALVVLLTAAIGLMRVQPEEDAALRAFLMPPPNCPSPCWQGIQLGAMSMEQADAMLRAHPWVDEVRFVERIDALSWRWNGSQPTFLTMERAFLSVTADHMIGGATVETSIPVGTLMLMLGQPETIYVLDDSDVIFVYPAANLDARVRPRCPTDARQFWQNAAEVRWKSAPSNYSLYRFITLHPGEDDGWQDALLSCGGSIRLGR
jgi:hypothetical protein